MMCQHGNKKTIDFTVSTFQRPTIVIFIGSQNAQKKPYSLYVYRKRLTHKIKKINSCKCLVAYQKSELCPSCISL